MIIGKPVEVKDYSIKNRDALIAKVQDVIVRNYYSGMAIAEGKESH